MKKHLLVYLLLFVLVGVFGLTGCSNPPPPAPAPIAPALYVPQADLAFDDVDITGTLSGGVRKYEIELSIINIGDLASNSFYVSVSGLGKELEVTNIWPGDIIPVVFNIDLVGGEQIIYINLDPDNRVAETDEDNNNHQISFPSLHEFVPDYAPLSAVQIGEYTQRALELTYEAETKEEWNIAKRWLRLAVYAVGESNFDEESYIALYMAVKEWKYESLSEEYRTEKIEQYKREAAESANDPDKDRIIEAIEYGLETVLGNRPGYGGSR